MKFSNLALFAAILPHTTKAGLRGGSRLMEEETTPPSQDPSSYQDPSDDEDNTFDVSAILEEIFDDELSPNHQEPEYEYTQTVEELVVLPPKSFLAEEWHVYVQDGSERMNQTVFMNDFVADTYPDVVFEDESINSIWDAYSQGQELLEREALDDANNTYSTLCTDNVEPNSICLYAKFQRKEFPEPMSDEDALKLYSDLISEDIYNRLLRDDSRPVREQAIVNIDEAMKEMEGLGQAIDKEAEKTESVALKDTLKESSAIAITVAETLKKCLPNDCDDAEMWLDITFDALLKLGPMVSKACPKCGIAMSAIGTIGKIVAIANGGNTEITTEQYPRALTARDIERALENALARGQSDGNEDFLVVLTASLNRASARWGRILTNVILPVSRSDEYSTEESETLKDSVIDRWYTQDFDREMTLNVNAMRGALVAHQNAFGSTSSSLRSRYNAWHNGCDSKCSFHNSETDNLIRRGLNTMKTCKSEMEDANEFLDTMESMYNSLTRTFVRFTAMVDQGVSVLYQYSGCSEQSFIDTIEQNGSLAANHGCKYAVAINTLVDMKERYDLYLFDLQTIYRDDFSDAVSVDDPSTCRDEGYPYYQKCTDFNEVTGECNYGNVVMITTKDREARRLNEVREMWNYVHGKVTTPASARTWCIRRANANMGTRDGRQSRTSFGGPARMGGRRQATQTYFSYVNDNNMNRMKRHPNVWTNGVCDAMISDIRERGTHRTPFMAPKCKNKGKNCDIETIAFPNMCPVKNVGTCGQRFAKDEFFKAH